MMTRYPLLDEALLKRGRRWGSMNAAILHALRSAEPHRAIVARRPHVEITVQRVSTFGLRTFVVSGYRTHIPGAE